MTPAAFVAKWRSAELKERSAAQEHFLDLCRLLDEPTPAEADPKGERYAFEKGATKATGGRGFADVWKRGHFALEYKSRGRSLDDAIDQLKRYALALDNPPLLIACNLERFRIVTNWTNAVSERHEFDLDGLLEPANLQKLKWAFSDPERLRPGLTRRHITEVAARKFADLARDLRAKGQDAQAVAHFVNRLVFCMFAEDIGLLPGAMFTRMLQAASKAPERFEALSKALFAAMKDGGMVGFEEVAWFDGGLFDDDSTLPLTRPHIELVLDAAKMDWSEIDPSIMGTLFERGLDPDKRSQLGAHYTDPDKIMKIIEPVIRRPLEAEWSRARAEIDGLLDRAAKARSPAARSRADNEALRTYRRFLERLRTIRVLDPACGSGNFLYLALHTLKDLEHRAGIEVEALGLQRDLPAVGPEQLLGIEINPFAAELARVSVWIGEIQWMQRNGFGIAKNPILRPLDTIECRDAILNHDGTEAAWPEADFIVGNPPFLGNKSMIGVLGEDYTIRLRNIYQDRVPGAADLVCYWFAKATDALEAGMVQQVGLVATQSIRKGASRTVLDRIRATGAIYEAWSDEPWTIEGAAVRVSLICFASTHDGPARLDGGIVQAIYSDLSAGRADLTTARRLPENAHLCFQGPVKVGPFDVPGDVGRAWLAMPLNPNGRPNSDVVRPWINGQDITRRSSDTWIVDFAERSEPEAAFYQEPFTYVLEKVKPLRDENRDRQRRERWWQLGRSGTDLRQAIHNCSRYIATSRVARYRLFIWCHVSVLPDSRVYAIARDDDTSFGLLHSRIHQLWALAMASRHGVGNDPTYNNQTCFETFPFPEGLTPDIPAADYADDPRAERIAEAARRLVELRDNWLNPPDLVVREPEVVPGYPDRILPKSEEAAKELRRRTLTNLYNQRPAWLANAHQDLDVAVAAAYGWPPDLPDDDILARLLALNLARAGGARQEAAK